MPKWAGVVASEPLVRPNPIRAAAIDPPPSLKEVGTVQVFGRHSGSTADATWTGVGPSQLAPSAENARAENKGKPNAGMTNARWGSSTREST